MDFSQMDRQQLLEEKVRISRAIRECKFAVIAHQKNIEAQICKLGMDLLEVDTMLAVLKENNREINHNFREECKVYLSAADYDEMLYRAERKILK